jgi:type IV pilus assembly protein PilV
MMKNRPLSRRRPKGQAQGFAMLEALVGLLIFSIGILGIVGVQASMTAAQTQSKFRADAASLAGELVGTMWSDMSNLSNYDGTGCAGYARCSDWEAKVANTLPSGTPTIALSAPSMTGAVVTGATITITITWLAPNETVPSRYVTVTSVRS